MESDDWTDLPTLWRESWRALAPRSGAPLAVLATIGLDGTPQARMLMLRRADADAGDVALYTDALTPKLAELRANPQAAIHVYDPALRLQIRLNGPVSAAPGTPAAWDAQTDEARGNYGVEPAPGTPIAAHGAYSRAPDRADRFMVLTMRVERLETVLLSRPTHRRALYRRADGWQGGWIAP